ncbi:hypothetical protein MHYP_G00172320 [Metynnis hypsauchen]
MSSYVYDDGKTEEKPCKGEQTLANRSIGELQSCCSNHDNSNHRLQGLLRRCDLGELEYQTIRQQLCAHYLDIQHQSTGSSFSPRLEAETLSVRHTYHMFVVFFSTGSRKQLKR